MSQPSVDAGQSGYFVPLAAMPGWTQAMQQASRAHRLGQVFQAMGFYHEALGLARDQLEAGRTDSEDACLAALITRPMRHPRAPPAATIYVANGNNAPTGWDQQNLVQRLLSIFR